MNHIGLDKLRRRMAERCTACRARRPGSCSCRRRGDVTAKGIDVARPWPEHRPRIPGDGVFGDRLRPYLPGIPLMIDVPPEVLPVALIETDPADTRVALVAGHRVYLGGSTLRKLFWHLAMPLGRAHRLADLQRLTDGFTTDAGLTVPPDQLRKAQQRLRQHLCRLAKAIAENGADATLVLMRRGGEVWLQQRFLRQSKKSLSARPVAI